MNNQKPRAGTIPPGAHMALAAAVLGFFIVTFDAVVLNVSLPSIRTDLGGGITGLQWVVDGYTLMFAALLLAAGAFSDRTGARRAFIIGVAGFATASAACGLAPGIGSLIAARFVQGAAAALLVPAGMALISRAFPEPSARARAIGMWAMGGAVASSSAPILGGLLTIVSWRLIFLINIPVGIAAVALAARTAPSPCRAAPFDGPGFTSGVLAMGALTFGVIEAGERSFTSPLVLGAFAVATLSTVAFAAWQRRAPSPIVPLELFRRRNVTVSVVVGFAFVVGYYGLPFLMSLYLQQLHGLSAFRTGLVFLPMMLVGGILTPFSAAIAERFGARTLVCGGLVLMTLGLATLAIVTPSATPIAVAALMLPVGLAGPFIMPPITSVLLNSVPDSLAGTASGVFNTSRQLGGALAIAVFGALLNQPYRFLAGVRISLTIAAVVAASAAATSRLLSVAPTP